MAAWPPKGRRELTARRPWSRQPAQAGRARASRAAGGRCQGRREPGSRAWCHLVVAALRSPRSPDSGRSPGSRQAPKEETVPGLRPKDPNASQALKWLLPARPLDSSVDRPPEPADHASETWVPGPVYRISRLHTPTLPFALLRGDNKLCQTLKSVMLQCEATFQKPPLFTDVRTKAQETPHGLRQTTGQLNRVRGSDPAAGATGTGGHQQAATSFLLGREPPWERAGSSQAQRTGETADKRAPGPAHMSLALQVEVPREPQPGLSSETQRGREKKRGIFK